MSKREHERLPVSLDETVPRAHHRVSRRMFLKVGSVGGAAAALAACSTPSQPAAEAPAAEAPTSASTSAPTTTPEPAPAGSAPSPLTSDLLPYPRIKLGTVADLTNGAFSAVYPDKDSPVQVLKLGSAVVGGAGPDGDIVAYSALCTHMGCPVSYDAARQIFQCPCHFSQFDVERDAMMINGPATQHLPRVVLEVDGQDIYAVGMQGLIYGRPHNLSLTRL